jgi:ribonuclease T1
MREVVARTGNTPDISLAALPAEARVTLQRIRAGGPFPYSRDGVVFNNRERVLPAMPRGYYREFTVPTPGATTRGGRRIVCGGDVATLSECYYSHDHYQSFRRIRP